ncbi:bifunctional acetylxylan esterase/glucomannan deacetylase [Cellvibrio japonicus]|uniref:Acetylxylan esterase / glucomannan deacetylase n=2 Tax=Cellvibrio japonicus TaxID=155077 RepID=CE2B_CELJU|nr:bifunctional acetylxylan esterase/glucomannan deacetylase [Cellvibrio japonicus]B3PDE5.1 RecName: Full=Acetylxylan esterase / glucomannan deacetylase; AltName: Full=CjCE2B; Flags: Precursor [Cellvibrio japonicus Ueda107]ACE85322.1 acetyl xylan esterase, putative, axe2A [Cellvibrio japonicus Ueda107]QEI13395.1 SGNH/GDSL hydrolase family protein [Cellvibrio japonicus]QEI16969.1 SGNH/GDSL hydrolase family protein [Cellvibrio japonicus]QEI20547.1 SGNH/GDSL hydrolase family protein [Cellvibrio j
MKPHALIGLLAGMLLSSSLYAADSTKPLPLHIGGRVLVESPANQPVSYTYSWPAVYFETAFKGQSLTLKFDDDQNIFRLIVDDKAPVVINKPGKVDYPVESLAPGKHRVRLEKLTETQSTSGRFLGFYTDPSAKPLALPKRKRQIEFIGDSFTVGYGNTSPSRECTDEELFKTTNSQMAFGPLTAKAFDADYQINASSGFGIVRNYNGTSPDKSLLSLYPYTLNNPDQLYHNKHWKPQVIVIGLGTNDFSTALNDNERWKTREALHADYVANYVKFVKQLHSNNARAQFILMNSDQSNGEIAEQVGKVVAQLKGGGLHQVEQIVFKGLDYSGCHWHPSANDDQLLANLLITHLQQKKGIW